MTDSPDYNLGYEDAREMVLLIISEMKETYNYHNPTLEELRDRIQ